MTPPIRVWAPKPKRVELAYGGRKIPMAKEPGDWWSLSAGGIGADEEYGFLLDGAGPFPDPRSARQDKGILGLSRRVDHAAFRWTDSRWQAPPLSAAIIYELHIGTFTPEGTFDAAIEKLNHLAQLGVTHVELMPVNQFSGRHGWGYDGADLFAPHHAYGEPDALKRLVNACHEKGLAVLLDVVYNHLGPIGNFLEQYGPYFTERYSTPWGKALNFDGASSGEVRRFFIDNAILWLRDYHFDGLRLDAVHAIVDTSARPFLEELAAEIRKLEAEIGRHLVLIPESDLNDPRLLWSTERAGFQLHAQWTDDFHHALHVSLTGETNGYYSDFAGLRDLAKAMRQAYVYDGCYSRDRRRPHGRRPDGLDGHRFVVYLQNHDQVGNRACGERLCHLVTHGRAKIGAALLLTSPFIPMLFQGEEWGASTPFLYFTDHQDAALGKAVSDGRRREFAGFGWNPGDIPDPQAESSFRRSKLAWGEAASGWHAEMLDWHRQLIRLRRAEPDLLEHRLGRVDTHYSEEEKWFVLNRGAVEIVANLDSRPRTIALGDQSFRRLLASFPAGEAFRHQVDLPPESVVILKRSA